MNRRNKGIVLVVDDQERNVQVVGSTLAVLGFEVMAASNGEQALARVAARQPDLILLDILMPEMDGFEVCTRLKEDPETADIPIIFLSAADDSNIIVRALEAGGVDYVTKPFNKAELLARVRTHIELKKWRDESADLLEQRDEFIAMMAHDLKNPLGGAHFSCQMLAELKEGIDEKAKRLAMTACDGVGRALDFVESFLQDAQSAQTDIEVKPRRVGLVDCVNYAIERHAQQAARKSINVLWEPPTEEISVTADPDALGRVLDNLISNALKFSPPDSEVSVSVDPELGEVRVKDCGPGFTEEDREHLFRSYHRLSARPTGGEPSTGLGLSIAKRLVLAMKGTLALDVDYDGGAEFVLSLPRPDY